MNLEFAQRVDFGEYKNIRFHGGVQYAHIENTLFVTDTVSISSFAASANETYNGFGPRVGADMSYGWSNGFSVYANGATLLLVGSSRFSDTESPNISGVTLSTASATAIVPELEVKIGAKYTYAIAQGDLSLDAGWMWLNYFNAQQDSDGTGIGTTQLTDFGLQGPYIGLKWLGNIA